MDGFDNPVGVNADAACVSRPPIRLGERRRRGLAADQPGDRKQGQEIRRHDE
jgi:hypothetical protein